MTITLSLLTSSSQASLSSKLESPSRIQKIRFGDSVPKILKRHGFSPRDIGCLNNKQSKFMSLRIRAGRPYLVSRLGEQAIRIALYKEDSPDAHVFTRSPSGCRANSGPIAWEVRTKTSHIKVKGSLHATLSHIFHDPRMITRFMDAFRFCCNLRSDLKRGDKITVIYEKLYDQNVFVKYGNFHQIEMELRGKKYSRYFLPLPGGGTFYGDGMIRKEAPLYLPVPLFHISSLYQRRRFHPVKKRRQAHMGIDFALPIGAPIYAARDGVILKKSRNRASGNYIEIQHEDFITKYLHMNSILPHLKEGDSIQAGEILGEIGCTGYCTKPHLHFAVKKGRSYIDPLPLLKVYAKPFELDFLNALTKIE